MNKLPSQKESICFNFENDDQKRFFDKAKKCDIIRNNNSIFLRKILSVKNQNLLNETLKPSKSQIFNRIKTSTYDPKNLNTNINNSSSNLTLIPNKTDSYQNILSPQICLDGVSLNNSFKIEISPKKILSPKIIVNKNKNLRLHPQKEKDKDLLLYPDNHILSEKDNINTINNVHQILNTQIKEKYGLNTVNTEYNINPEISFSNLYTKNYIRKPVVINFKNGFNSINIKEKNNTDDKRDLSKEKNKENIPNNNQQMKKVKTENKIKPYNFYKKNNLETELFRSFEDLEKKSLEISKRKMKKNSFYSISSFKKENNLDELKESLENYRVKTKSNLRRKKKKKEKFINYSDNNNIKNGSLKIIKNNNYKALNSNENKISKIEEYNSNIKNQSCSNTNITRHWHRPRSNILDNINFSLFNDSKCNKNKRSNFVQIPKVKSEELLISNSDRENMKKKSIKINIIEENKTENIYNITLNTNNVNETFNRFHVSLNYDQNFKYKNYIIRQKYGKKHNINENSKIQVKSLKIKKQSDLNQNFLISKKFIEENKIKYNLTELNHCQSHVILPNNQTNLQIKVNKKNNSGKKIIEINSCHRNINSILDLEEKINDEINQHLKIINGFEKMDEFIANYRKKILKKKFILFCNYCEQIGTINNTTILTNTSQLSELKYTKKILNKRKTSNIKDNYSSKTIMRNKSFNSEKQKVLIIKRKEFGFFEKYEHSLDLITNFRLLLIKFSIKNNGI